MKTLIVSFITVLAATTNPGWAQSEPYEQAMVAAISTMSTQQATTAPAGLLTLANRFERIASAEPKQWLPRYYAGLMYVYLGFVGNDATEKDKFLDQADANLRAAEATAMDDSNDELAVLKAYIAQSRMVVDPMNRWQKYGLLFQAGIEKAKSLNPQNPRAYLLEGSSLMYTPVQFGGGPDAGCPILKQAAEKFASFKPTSDLHPVWGQKQMGPLLEKCK